MSFLYIETANKIDRCENPDCIKTTKKWDGLWGHTVVFQKKRYGNECTFIYCSKECYNEKKSIAERNKYSKS
jgi:hypothetical protein